MAEKTPGSKEFAAAALEAYNKFAATKGADSLRKLFDSLFNLNAALREEVQKSTLEPVKIIISKLEKNTPLTPDDMQFIRLWLVGDAEAYAARENDFSGWITELTRLMTTIAQTAPQATDVRANMAVQGTVTDALGLIPNMQKFMEALDRVKRFENSTRTMDAGTMLAVKNLLEGKIKSTND
ncbi:MAG: hypothetical protein A2234_01455 [Elusimicrobia bacterium RIFOXYA2_FULL_58_8]|nr:MAG: hypothetical protein A2285_09735 [Elusimicrobia bacterium RIFOXYA12_FULL_57_11]OGS15376.1 MAG: hypothetical protein A2234_01455 [Elusimicrobia bacterium RIFOXYA2_FULL_58_8]